MIHKINLKDSKNSNFSYINNKDISKEFNIPNEIEFKKGKNVLIGENGCGKSTLINIIAEYTFCKKTEYSKITETDIHKMFQTTKTNLGIKVYANYDIPTYKTVFGTEQNTDDVLSNIHSFKNHFLKKSMSGGEETLQTIQSLFEIMFDGEHLEFDKSLLKRSTNDVWKEMFDKLESYFKENHIKEEVPIYTILLDEPDRNLSLKHINMLYTILSVDKGNEQMICAIHNPMLIYKLSQLEHINFIELTPNYLKNIKNFIKK
jgi:predicted ATPase